MKKVIISCMIIASMFLMFYGFVLSQVHSLPRPMGEVRANADIINWVSSIEFMKQIGGGCLDVSIEDFPLGCENAIFAGELMGPFDGYEYEAYRSDCSSRGATVEDYCLIATGFGGGDILRAINGEIECIGLHQKCTSVVKLGMDKRDYENRLVGWTGVFFLVVAIVLYIVPTRRKKGGEPV